MTHYYEAIITTVEETEQGTVVDSEIFMGSEYEEVLNWLKAVLPSYEEHENVSWIIQEGNL